MIVLNLIIKKLKILFYFENPCPIYFRLSHPIQTYALLTDVIEKGNFIGPMEVSFVKKDLSQRWSTSRPYYLLPYSNQIPEHRNSRTLPSATKRAPQSHILFFLVHPNEFPQALRILSAPRRLRLY